MKTKIVLLTFFSCLFLTVNGQSWDEIVKSVASDRALSDAYGFNVSISGDRAVVGAYREDDDVNGNNELLEAGSVYVLEFNGGVWTESAKLVASDRGANDLFGSSVSISDDKIIVGAYAESEDVNGTNTLSNAGSAYIFELNAGVWTQTAKLVASDRGQDDYFGYSVSISGDKAIVGARNESENVAGIATMNQAGSAYIFELSGGAWLETQKIVASDRAAYDYFGYSVSISGDKAIIGAYVKDAISPVLTSSGAAYIFELSGGSWVETAKLEASDKAAHDRFGNSVSISGDRVIVGAYTENDDATGGNTLPDTGSAYIFELNGGVWSETAKIVASDREGYDYFGFSVCISGDKVIVGAYAEDHDLVGANTLLHAGSAYIFELNGGVWAESTKLIASDRDESDYFGYCVSIDGDKAIVGAHNEDHDASGGNMLGSSGSAYLFSHCNTSMPTGAPTQNFCSNDTATISDLEAIGDNIQWYDQVIGGNLLNNSDTLMNGTTYYATATVNGCESHDRLAVQVVINAAPITTLTETPNSLTADESGATYQWLDCDNGNQIIANETSQTFVATLNGNYAVIIDNGVCSDTSECYALNFVGLEEEFKSQVFVSPNPSSGVFTVNVTNSNQAYTISELTGKVVRTGVLESYKNELDITDLPDGVYYLKVNAYTLRLVKR